MQNISKADYLKVYQQIEDKLKKMFLRFSNLCNSCFKNTLESSKLNKETSCCCICDNQVSQWYKWLENAQIKQNKNWKKSLPVNTIEYKGKKPRACAGPCKALSCKGCTLKCLRPPSCSTLVCVHQVKVLQKLNLIDKKFVGNIEIEQIFKLKNPMYKLYGYDFGEVSLQEVQDFIKAIDLLTNKINSIDDKDFDLAVESIDLTTN